MRKTSQKIMQCLFWSIIALLFLSLSIVHFMQIGRDIDGIDERVLARGLVWSPGTGEEPTNLFEQIDNAIVSMDNRIGQLNRKNDCTNRLAAGGYFLATVAAVGSAILSFRQPASSSVPGR